MSKHERESQHDSNHADRADVQDILGWRACSAPPPREPGYVGLARAAFDLADDMALHRGVVGFRRISVGASVRELRCDSP